jgi:hypothetical protein
MDILVLSKHFGGRNSCNFFYSNLLTHSELLFASSTELDTKRYYERFVYIPFEQL